MSFVKSTVISDFECRNEYFFLLFSISSKSWESLSLTMIRHKLTVVNDCINVLQVS